MQKATEHIYKLDSKQVFLVLIFLDRSRIKLECEAPCSRRSFVALTLTNATSVLSFCFVTLPRTGKIFAERRKLLTCRFCSSSHSLQYFFHHGRSAREV